MLVCTIQNSHHGRRRTPHLPSTLFLLTIHINRMNVLYTWYTRVIRTEAVCRAHRPLSMAGMHDTCTGVGVAMPTAAACRCSQSATPSFSNVVKTAALPPSAAGATGRAVRDAVDLRSPSVEDESRCRSVATLAAAFLARALRLSLWDNLRRFFLRSSPAEDIVTESATAVAPPRPPPTTYQHVQHVEGWSITEWHTCQLANECKI